MAGSIATAYVQVIPSMRGIKSNLSKEFEDQGGNAGGHFGAGLVKKALAVFSVAQLGRALGATLAEGANLQQNLGGVEAVFGAFAADVTATAQDAYRKMGLSASDYMATANKMGSLFKGSGLETQRAMELSSKAMQRAADVASVMGIDMEMAMESIAGAAKGNFTMMDNLGVAMNATTLQAYALEKGINFEWNVASNAEKAELAMAMFFERTEDYAGNFERESRETFSGAFGAMKAAAQNVLGNLALGNDITPSLLELAQTTETFLTGNLWPMVMNIFRGLAGAAVTLIRETDWRGLGSDIIQGIVKGLWSAAGALLNALRELLGQAMGKAKASLGLSANALELQGGSGLSSVLRLSPGGGGRLRGTSGGVVNHFTQNVYARAVNAAELAQETRYQAERKVLLGV